MFNLLKKMRKDDIIDSIAEFAKKDFGDSNIDDSSYISLQRTIISSFLNGQYNINEISIATKLKLDSLNNSTRYIYSANMLSLFAFLISCSALIFSLTPTIEIWRFLSVIILIIISVTVGVFSLFNIFKTCLENDEKVYLKFKLLCIDIINTEM